MPRKNRQLRPKNATPKPDCKRPATKGADRFREAQKIAIIRHKFGVHLGNPGLSPETIRSLTKT